MILLNSLFVISLFFKNLKVNNNIKFYLMFIILFFVSILREFKIITTGNDTNSYYDTFLYLLNIPFKDIMELSIWMEKGYLFYNKIIGLFTSNGYMFLDITYFIILYSFFKFIKVYSKDIFFSIFIFIGYRFFPESLTMLRQILAISIILWSIKYILKKNIIKYFFFILLASLFHKTSLICIVLYLSNYIKFNNKKIILFLIFMLLSFLCFDEILFIILKIFPSYTLYLERNYYFNNNLGCILYTLISFVMILPFLLNKNDKSITKLKNLEIFGYLLAFFVSLMSIKFALLIRVTLYFQIFYLISIPNISINSNNKRIYYIFMFSFIVFYNILVYFIRPEWNLLFNYRIINF